MLLLQSPLTDSCFHLGATLTAGDRTQVLGALADGSHLFHYSYPHGCKAGHLTSFPPSCMLEMEPGASCKLGKTCTPGLQCFSFVFFFLIEFTGTFQVYSTVTFTFGTNILGFETTSQVAQVSFRLGSSCLSFQSS